jgi:hypothetical protein
MKAVRSWTIAKNKLHNAFTDLTFWRDQFWLVYTASPWHLASKRSQLVLLRSSDAQSWQEAARFDGYGEDIRDPKLAVIQDQLTLIALLNKTIDPQPYTSIVTHSPDGTQWSAFEQITPTDWLLGKPKSIDQINWYTPAHRLDSHQVVLLKSQNGLQWEQMAAICTEAGADETALEFLPDGNLIAVTRIEGQGSLFGSDDAGTSIAISDRSYTTWKKTAFSTITRLDGPNLFTLGGEIYAVGRYQPKIGKRLRKQGSILSPKRTSLFHMDSRGLTYLIDLPSSGDTAYAGAAIHKDEVYISYYTNKPNKDHIWLLGMMLPTQVDMAVFTLSDLKTLIKVQRENNE